MNSIVHAYLTAALWATCDDEGDPLSNSYGIEDVDERTKNVAVIDCDKFKLQATSLLREMRSDQIGHDLFLTRNGHGVGFWDRDLGEVGDKLTKLAEAMGPAEFYVGDDDKIYSM